uniref:Uncharacterized protein n=1 Tax=Quercus lobata TaxID=97700 RepID=A0A7N2M4N1_QUELO
MHLVIFRRWANGFLYSSLVELLDLRVCHKLTTKLKREVVLGSSSIDDPPQFITMLTAHELSIDDLQI